MQSIHISDTEYENNYVKRDNENNATRKALIETKKLFHTPDFELWKKRKKKM